MNNLIELSSGFRDNKEEMKICCVYRIRILKTFGISAITLYPFIFFADSKGSVSDGLFRHELEHIYQVRRLGWFQFYFCYLKSYFILRSKGHSHHVSYWSIPFEIEARESEKLMLSKSEAEIFGKKQT